MAGDHINWGILRAVVQNSNISKLWMLGDLSYQVHLETVHTFPPGKPLLPLNFLRRNAVGQGTVEWLLSTNKHKHELQLQLSF